MALTTDVFRADDIVRNIGPYTQCFSIAKSDANFLADASDNPRPVSAILVTGAGTLKVTMVDQVDGDAVTLTLAASVIYPIAVKKVWNTGTATGVFGFI